MEGCGHVVRAGDAWCFEGAGHVAGRWPGKVGNQGVIHSQTSSGSKGGRGGHGPPWPCENRS